MLESVPKSCGAIGAKNDVEVNGVNIMSTA